MVIKTDKIQIDSKDSYNLKKDYPKIVPPDQTRLLLVNKRHTYLWFTPV